MSTFFFFSVLMLFVTVIPAATFGVNYRPVSESKVGLLSFFWFGLLGGVILFLTICAGIVFIGLVFSLIPIILAAVAAICRRLDLSKSRARIWIATTAVALDIGLVTWWSVILWEIDDQLRLHPLTTLTQRIEYEREFRAIRNFELVRRNNRFEPWNVYIDPVLNHQFPSAKNVDFAKLQQLETGLSEAARELEHGKGFRYGWMLKSLLAAHRSTETQFATTAGSGVIRTWVMPYRNWRFDLPTAPLLPLAAQKVCLTDNAKEVELSAIGTDFERWHEDNFFKFANPVTFGMVDWDWNANRPDLSRVVGFQPHAFGSRPDPFINTDDGNSRWKIDVLSLMSLLKHHPSAVYLSENLPNLEELGNVPTRPLNEFESISLERLQAGEELVVRAGDESIRMVGSIRAAVQCLECHQVPRGTLLGAFSYQLSRDQDLSSDRNRDSDRR